MKAYERLLNYVKIHTTSDDQSNDSPTSQRQFDLARVLVKELEDMGASEVYLDPHCYVYAKIPATPGHENSPKIGFIAHMDTAPDFSGENVVPQIIENYDGGDVTLGNGERTLKVSDFPHLAGLKGRTLITTDGTTLLGADDKAGVAEIMTLAELLLTQDIPHGQVSIGFTPDEEVGKGPDWFDIDRFGADFAFTADGGEAGEIVYENFNAAAAEIEINGFNVHPGSSKNTMINALQVATEFNFMLPSGETPRDTQGYEGFFHLHRLEGTVEKVKMEYIIRDHDAGCFFARQRTMEHIVKLLNEKYGEGTVSIVISEQYRNMAEVMEPHVHIIENVKEAISSLGIEPYVEPIRGGTDGARLSFMGLPCPNIGTGGYAFHGPYEHITVEGMEASLQIMLGIVKKYS